MFDVLVIGAANMDVKARLSGPHTPATSNPGAVTLTAGGVGRNIAHNLGRLGASVALVTMFGDDLMGQPLRVETESASVNLTHAITANLPTSTYIATLDHTGELITAVNDMRIIDTLTPDYLPDVLNQAHWIVADCNLPIATLMFLAAHHGDRLIIETVSVPKSEKLLHILSAHQIFSATPNLDQLKHLTKETDIALACHKLQRLGLKTVVVHRGSFGATYCATDGTLTDVQQQKALKVVDVTGAGDAATSGFVYALNQKQTALASVAFGQRAAAALVGITGSVLTASLAAHLISQ